MFNQRAMNLKRKHACGETSVGIWMQLPSPIVAEIIAGAGYDWVVVDWEHSAFSPETLVHMLMAFNGSDTVPLIRVPWNDQVMIKQVLDMGWDGVVVPQVNTVDAARQAVAACRYPPVGNRGFGPLRAGGYGRDEDEYARFANESVICIAQVEDAGDAEQHIDEIVRVPGIDGIWVGRWDMSGSIGRFLQADNPIIWDTVHKVFDAARTAGIPTGNALVGVETIEKAVGMGCQWIVVGKDVGFLRGGLDGSLQAYRRFIETRQLLRQN